MVYCLAAHSFRLSLIFAAAGRVAKLETELKQKQGSLQELHEQINTLQARLVSSGTHALLASTLDTHRID